MSQAGATDSVRGPDRTSVWAEDEEPQTLASPLAFAAANLVAMFAAGMVFIALLAFAFLIGLLTADGLTTEEFFDRAGKWAAFGVAPLAGAAYLGLVRGCTQWFGNRLVGWPDAAVGLVVTVGVVLVFLYVGIGVGIACALAASLLVGVYFRARLS
jgi:hypothetical protein